MSIHAAKLNEETVAVVIVGPTASGKTNLAIELAWPLGEQVICLDRHTCIQGMNVGTATPTLDERWRVTHHMVDIVPFAEAPLARRQLADFATTTVNDLSSQRQGISFIVSGSARLTKQFLYSQTAQARRDNYSRLLRDATYTELIDYCRRHGYPLPYLHADVDSSPRNAVIARQNILENIEYYRNLPQTKPAPSERVLVLGLERTPAELKRSIAKRTHKLMRSGLKEEVAQLVASNNGKWSDFLLDTIGYREFEPYFMNKITLEAVEEAIAANTFRYAMWQLDALSQALPDIQWVRTADEAKARIARHATKHLHPQRPKSRAVIFDADGTLFPGNSWYALTRGLGASVDEHRHLIEDYRAAIIDYQTARQGLLRLWQATGNANKQFMTNLIDSWQLDPAATTIAKAAKAYGRTCLITGSVDLYARRIATELGLDEWHANTTLHWDIHGRLVDFDYDVRQAERKLQQFAVFCHSWSLEPLDCIVVGDHTDDLGMFAMSRHGILVGDDHTPEITRHAWRRAKRLSDVATLLHISK